MADSKITYVEIVCKHCEKASHFSYEVVSFHADTYECGSCGTHGAVEITVDRNCSYCQKDFGTIIVSEW